MRSGTIFNLQRYSLHDGPGIRTTVFLKGCPLCCSWCHNPEGIAPRRDVVLLENRCLACGECRTVCPFASAMGGEGPLPARNDYCTRCQACVEVCPTGARETVGRVVSVAELLCEIEADRVFYEESGGGVTFSGGEPLSQPDFVLALLEACRSAGIHTALDTSGFGCTEKLLELARIAELVLFDLKLIDEARHREHCGVPNAPILANLEALASLNTPVWLRVPVVPGITDDAANLSAVAALAARLPNVVQVNLLPYHATGAAKFSRVGRDYALAGLAAPSPEAMQRAVEHLQPCGRPVKIGG